MVCTHLDMEGGSTCTLASGCGQRLQRSIRTLHSTRTCTASVGSARAGGLRSCLDGCPPCSGGTRSRQTDSLSAGIRVAGQSSNARPASPVHPPIRSRGGDGGSIDAELVQRSFQALVGHGSEAGLVTQRTWLAIFPDTLDACLAIAVSATADKVRLAKDLKADGALALELLLWWLDEFAFVPTFLFRLSRRLLVVVTAGGFTSHFSWNKKGRILLDLAFLLC